MQREPRDQLRYFYSFKEEHNWETTCPIIDLSIHCLHNDFFLNYYKQTRFIYLDLETNSKFYLNSFTEKQNNSNKYREATCLNWFIKLFCTMIFFLILQINEDHLFFRKKKSCHLTSTIIKYFLLTTNKYDIFCCNVSMGCNIVPSPFGLTVATNYNAQFQNCQDGLWIHSPPIQHS